MRVSSKMNKYSVLTIEKKEIPSKCCNLFFGLTLLGMSGTEIGMRGVMSFIAF